MSTSSKPGIAHLRRACFHLIGCWPNLVGIELVTLVYVVQGMIEAGLSSHPKVDLVESWVSAK